MSGSVAFDRAAEYYDATRGLSPESVQRTTDMLVEAFQGAGPILEVGIGTGQVAVPLRAAGVDVSGLDLSRPILDQLVPKDPDRRIPAVEGDATNLPIRDRAFGGAYLRWVLHLVPAWKAAVDEIVRVVRPGGTFVAGLGSYGGIWSEIQARFAEITGVTTEPVGLTWEVWDELDRAIAAHGGEKLPDATFEAVDRDDLESFVRGIDRNMYSWTWAVADDGLRAGVAAESRAWVEARWARSTGCRARSRCSASPGIAWTERAVGCWAALLPATRDPGILGCYPHSATRASGDQQEVRRCRSPRSRRSG